MEKNALRKSGDFKYSASPDADLIFLNWQNGELFSALIESLSTEQIKKIPSAMNFLSMGTVIFNETDAARNLNYWLNFITSINPQTQSNISNTGE